jgi:predicted transcriptional regulator
MHNAKMKTAALPSLRVDPQLRVDAELLLRDGETLSGFMAEALRSHIERRRAQDEFIERGLAAAEEVERTGKFITADAMLAKLEAKLAKHKASAKKTRNN